MKFIKLESVVLLVLLLFIAIFPAHAMAQVLGKHGPFTATLPQNYKCSETVTVNIKSKSKSAFKKKQKDLAKIVGLIRTALAFECPKANEIQLVGLHKKKQILQTQIAKRDNWRLNLAKNKSSKAKKKLENAKSNQVKVATSALPELYRIPTLKHRVDPETSDYLYEYKGFTLQVEKNHCDRTLVKDKKRSLAYAILSHPQDAHLLFNASKEKINLVQNVISVLLENAVMDADNPQFNRSRYCGIESRGTFNSSSFNLFYKQGVGGRNEWVTRKTFWQIRRTRDTAGTKQFLKAARANIKSKISKSGSNDLVGKGYVGSWLEYEDEKLKVYTAQKKASRTLDLVFMHTINNDESIYKASNESLTEKKIRTYFYLEKNEFQKIQKIVDIIGLPNSSYSFGDQGVRVFHYVQNYISPEIINDPHGANSYGVEKPFAVQELELYWRDKAYVKPVATSINRRIYVPLILSVKDAKTYEKYGSLEEEAINNPLASRGFLSARLAHKGDGYEVYVAKIKRKGYASVLPPSLVIIHSNKSIEDTIVPHEEVQPGWFKYTKEYGDFIIDLANNSFREDDFIKDSRKGFRVFHFLKDMPLEKVDYDGIKRPYIHTSFGHYDKPKPHYAYGEKEQHNKTASSFQELMQKNEAWEKSIALEQNAEKNKLSTGQKSAINKKVNQERADLYGYIYRGDSYWQEYRTWRAKKLSKKLQERFRGKQPDIADYFNGDVQSNLRHDGKLAWPLLRFIENTADQCPQNLPKDHVVREIVTTETSTRRNRFGPNSVRTNETRRAVKMSKRFSRLYEKYFQVLQNDKANRADNFAMSALNNLSNTSISDIADFSTILQEPMWAVDWMFTKEGCDSKALVQLGENMARLGEGRASVQSEGLAYNGTKKTAGASKKLAASNLLYEEYKSGMLTLTYSSLSSKWVPNIDEMVKHAKANYPLTFRFRGSVEAPIKIKAKVSNVVGNNSLKELDMTVPGEWTGQLDSDLYQFYSNGAAHGDPVFAKLLGQRSPRLRIVQCYYQNGSYYPFWYKSSPTAAEYKNAPSSHIFKAIQPPRKNCPETYDGPHNTFGHLKPAGSTAGSGSSSSSSRFH